MPNSNKVKHKGHRRIEQGEEYFKKINQLPLKNLDPQLDFVVGAIIVSPKKEIFVQKRSMNRELFSGCWDMVGGHVEKNETLLQALSREVFEETGWKLKEITALVQEFHWEVQVGQIVTSKIEFDFLVTVEGDLSSPILEKDTHDDCRWINDQDIEFLKDGRAKEDSYIYSTIKKAFTMI